MAQVGSLFQIPVTRCGLLIIEQLGFSEEVELEIFPDQLVIRSAHAPRFGWAEQFSAMAEAGDDQLLDDKALSLTEWDEVVMSV